MLIIPSLRRRYKRRRHAPGSYPGFIHAFAIVQTGKIVRSGVLPIVGSMGLAIFPSRASDDPCRLGHVAQTDEVVIQAGGTVEPVDGFPAGLDV
jgi:hypothetical protein